MSEPSTVVTVVEQTVTVTGGGESTVVVIPEAEIRIVSVGTQGPAGPAGPAGPTGPQGPAGDATSIGGIPVSLSSPQTFDVLAYSGSAWTNRPQAAVTDGGNF